jgi:GntR family transcriptional regulator
MRTAYFSITIKVRPDIIAAAPLRMAKIYEDPFRSRPGEVDVIIGADSADSRDARVMRTPVGSPLVTREITYFAEDGPPIEIVFDRFRADRVHFGGTSAI